MGGGWVIGDRSWEMNGGGGDHCGEFNSGSNNKIA